MTQDLSGFSPSRQHQRGLGFLGMLFFVVVIGACVLLAMKIVPSAIEYQAILKTIERVKNEPTIPAVRSAFGRAASIDDITSIGGADLIVTPIEQPGAGFTVAFDYKKELPLFGPASLVLNYKGSTH